MLCCVTTWSCALTNTFDLLREPIVPAVRADHQRVWVRILDITSPHEGHALLQLDTSRPDCDTSLTEFLIGLLAVVFDPIATQIAWTQRWQNPPSAAELEAALAPFAAAFHLDGDGVRFFQDRDDLDGNGETPVSALFMDAPAEHFVKPGTIPALSRRGAALALLTLQTSAPAGGAGHRTSLRGGGPLTTLVVPGSAGDRPVTLWQRLWANVPERFGAASQDIARVFPWMGPTRTSEKGSRTETTTPDDVHLAQAFFGMPRRIRLRFQANPDRLPCALTGEIDDTIVTHYITKPWGTNYVGWGKDHPLSPCYKGAGNAGYLHEHLKSARIGYRDWLGYVFQKQTGDSLPAASVATFLTKRASELSRIDQSIGRRARLIASGFSLDKMKPLDYGEALLPLVALPASVRDEDRGFVLSEIAKVAHGLVAAAEQAATLLSAAVRRGLYGDAPNVSRTATTLDTAKARLWADTEPSFYDVIRKAPEAIARGAASTADEATPLSRQWLAKLGGATLAIYDDMVPLDSTDVRSPEAYKQIVEGRSQLTAAFAGLTPGGKKIYTLLHLTPPAKKPAAAKSPQQSTAARTSP